jgi:aminoglycoside 6'-N-acetyltransferase I
MEVTLRRVTQEDKAEWLRMRKGIWPEAPDEYLDFDMDEILVSADYMVIFACVDGNPIGLTEVRIRDYGEGCETSPVGYLEGWFVQEEYRGKSVVGIMTQAAEDWVREKGCTEMASDTWLDNESSIRAHVKMGYTEVERLVHYVKQL